MKLSKSLLQAILVGVTLGATAVSCTKESLTDDSTQNPNDTWMQKAKNNHEITPPAFNCPACGMG